jgi:hypothetical protein
MADYHRIMNSLARCQAAYDNMQPGTTLRAAGWRLVGQAGGGAWGRENRPRVDKHPTQGKLRFEITANAEGQRP